MKLFHNVQISTTNPGPSSQAYANFAGWHSVPVSKFSGHTVYHASLEDFSSWILDSGATNHMTPHKHLLHNIQPLLSPSLVTLPNGYNVRVTSFGSLLLFSDIILHNVLLVPSFHYNLISIHQLSTQLNTSVLFTNSTCYMQDPFLKSPLVIGKVDHGLYILRIPSVAAVLPDDSDSSRGGSHTLAASISTDSSSTFTVPCNVSPVFLSNVILCLT